MTELIQEIDVGRIVKVTGEMPEVDFITVTSIKQLKAHVRKAGVREYVHFEGR